MNWLFIIVILLLVLFGLYGYWRGLLKILLSFASLILSIILVSAISPHVSDFIETKTPVYESLKNKCEDVMIGDSGSSQSESQQIESSYLPSSIQKLLEENNNSAVYQAMNVTGFNDYVAGALAKIIINAISFIITFLIVFIALRIAMRILNLVGNLPVIKGINKFAGLAFGICQALIIIWIGFIFITIFSSQELGKTCFTYINESSFLSLLYNNNLLMNIISSFI